eukprot:TRINITY_DN8033_c0_g1_i1.p1 TRINITY_DN8033_c0_g1~~TRINITY_DN8033_c0_g1_i1.p1  ORF type:complete len:133 (-),score=32.58 TRINITY_DN8033_c0_g1_i1:16-414(-)
MSNIAKVQPVSIPQEPPNSFFQFEKNWRNFTTLEEKYVYFKNIQPSKYSSLFKSSMTSDLVIEISAILEQFYLKVDKNESGAAAVLWALSKLDRFDMVSLFFSESEKKVLNQLFSSLQNTDNIQVLKKSYGL